MHTHMSAITAVSISLMVLVVLGTIRILALRFEGHPLAEAFHVVYG